jgi:hypothetical protein
LIFFFSLKIKKIIVIHKLRKTQPLNLEFGHTWGEIQKTLQKKKPLTLKGGGRVGGVGFETHKIEFHLIFPFS